jgi:hypothetical protein
MAKQCGPLFFECTWDDLTFYKMEGNYYVRKKSSLTREKVLTHKAFEKTRFYASLLVTASKIASSIYSDLPIDWRQFWMFRSFTGEGLLMLEGGATPQEVYDYLWKTYVEYWAIYQHTTGIKLRTGRTSKKAKPRVHKTRIRHRGSFDKYRRYARLIGKNHWKSSYDHTADLLEQEEKGKRKALNDAAYQRLLDKERRLAEEQQQQDAAVREVQEIADTRVATSISLALLAPTHAVS